MPSANPWTPAEDAVLRRMKNAGMAWQDISVALGRTAEAVRSRWRSASAQEERPASGSREWTDAEDARLEAACATGGTWADVAKAVGGSRSARACETRAGLLGLKRRSSQERKRPDMLSRRRCHDCGRPTTDYRCPACLAAWRRRNGVPGAGGEADEGYSAFGARCVFD